MSSRFVTENEVLILTNLFKDRGPEMYGEVFEQMYPLRLINIVQRFISSCPGPELLLAVIDRPGLSDIAESAIFAPFVTELPGAFRNFQMQTGVVLPLAQAQQILPMALCAMTLYVDLIAYEPISGLYLDVDHDWGVFVYQGPRWSPPPG